MSERKYQTVIDEEYDPGHRYCLSVELFNTEGAMVAQFEMDRTSSPEQIAKILRECSRSILLDASRIYPAEYVINFSRALSQSAREVEELERRGEI